MLDKDLHDKTLSLISALMTGYEVPYEDTIIALDKNLSTIRHTEVIRDEITIDTWIPIVFETGIAFYSSLAKRLSQEEFDKIYAHNEKMKKVFEG
jgi:hypothetical protein